MTTAPVIAPRPSTPGPRAAAHPGSCSVCGSLPAVRVKRRFAVGLLVFVTWRVQTLTVCRPCGLAQVRQWQNITLVAGWWGLPGLVVNTYAVITNAVALRRLARVAPPFGEGPGLAPGKPVWQRGGFVFAALFATAVVVSTLLQG